MVIERRAHNLQFLVLIMQRGPYVAISDRFHHGGKVSGSYQNSSPVVISSTVENKFFRKTSIVTSLPNEIAN